MAATAQRQAAITPRAPRTSGRRRHEDMARTAAHAPGGRGGGSTIRQRASKERGSTCRHARARTDQVDERRREGHRRRPAAGRRRLDERRRVHEDWVLCPPQDATATG
eukprot:5876531-Prymnesium_polylepis.1